MPELELRNVTQKPEQIPISFPTTPYLTAVQYSAMPKTQQLAPDLRPTLASATSLIMAYGRRGLSSSAPVGIWICRATQACITRKGMYYTHICIYIYIHTIVSVVMGHR